MTTETPGGPPQKAEPLAVQVVNAQALTFRQPLTSFQMTPASAPWAPISNREIKGRPVPLDILGPWEFPWTMGSNPAGRTISDFKSSMAKGMPTNPTS